MQALAILFSLAAAACLYLASPNQVLMVDANGKVHHVTKDSDPELFYAIPW